MVITWVISLLLVLFSVALIIRILGWTARAGRLVTVEELNPDFRPDRYPADLPRIQWLGHSSYRVDWEGETVLLDPVLAGSVSIAPRLCEVPDKSVLDGVNHILVSHGHMDHLDNGTLECVASCDLYLPRKSERFLSKKVKLRHQVHTFGLMEPIQLGCLLVTPVPARHGGWRYPWQKGYFACGFVVSNGKTSLYYAGDTAWGTHFADIGKQFAPAISIIPIGGYSPRWFLKSRHLNPEEAVKAIGLLGSRWNLPAHFGTYRVSLEAVDQPLQRFRQALLNH